jgi:hypothetical protein
MGLVILVLLILLLVGALPNWPHSRNYGYAPSSIVVLLVVILLVLLLTRTVPWGW